MHTYGTIGPWHDDEGHHQFGDRVDDASKLLELSKRIQTFTESSSHADQLRKIVSEAEILVFLGFGYIPENLQLLGPNPETRSTRQIYGTAFDMSHPNVGAVSVRLAHFLSPDAPHWASPPVELATLKCAPFLDNYSLPITWGG